MKKRYLKNIKDVIALSNTDTKIYVVESSSVYYRFVDGKLCEFYTDRPGFTYITTFTVEPNQVYIEVEDELSEDYIEELSEDYIGKLGWFWDTDESRSFVDILGGLNGVMYVAKSVDCPYEHFRPLTPEEVEKYTGYKVCSGH